MFVPQRCRVLDLSEPGAGSAGVVEVLVGHQVHIVELIASAVCFPCHFKNYYTRLGLWGQYKWSYQQQ
jgi:hypothetical protein